MSVSNLSVGPDCILILSDTALYGADGHMVGFCQEKTFRLGGGAIAMVGRGSQHALLRLAASLALHTDFDNLTAILRPQALAAHAPVPAGITGADRAMEITVAGFSRRAGRMIARRWRWGGLDGTGADGDTLADGVHMSPAGNAPHVSTNPASPDLMVRAALRQHEIATRGGQRRICIGGLMHLTTCRADGCTTAIAAAYPDRGRWAAQFPDPNEKEYAEWLGRQTLTPLSAVS